MTTNPADGPADVVNLEQLRTACRPVVALYRRFLDSGCLDLDMAELDEALASMRRLPVVGGRIGRALALVASGGAGASTEDVIAALDLLSAAPGLVSGAADPPTFGLSRHQHGRIEGFAQPSLPGID
jgi:hypothetical protein